MNEPEAATEKAKDLVRMALAKAALKSSLPKVPIEVKQSGLVIGGGISGMQAALELAKQGFEAVLVEKEKELGGLVRRLHYGLKGEDIPKYLSETIEKINSNDRITVYTNTTVKNVAGYVGNFASTLDQNGEEKRVEHGAVIVATGGIEYKPKEYLYGKNDKVITQLEFDNILFKKEIEPNTKTVVMIQCVGCRDENRTYCSRVCCVEAVKNALKVKEERPDISVFILFKDMRTYGFREIYYEEAAKQGVKFIRYDDESKPVVSDENGLEVKIYDHFLNEDIILKPDYLVLSAATLPNPDNHDLAQLLKVPLSKDGFFLEAHMKLRPVEFATDGIFLCGLAHSPKFFNECISQASAAVSRAATILSKTTLEAEGMVSVVDEEKCTGCGTCIIICPFNAIMKDENGIARVTAALCKGCGTCAASCPEKAISINEFTDEQLIAQVKAAVKEVP
jgi:heterodisulfide reductase subunit A